MQKTKGKHAVLLLLLAGTILFLAMPAEAAAGIRSGLRLCAASLIPSLFPVSVLTGCMLQMGALSCFSGKAGALLGRILHCHGAALLALCFGLIGGYPLGAMLLSELCKNGSLSQKQALRASALCNHAGPAFLIGAVGAGVFSDPWLGVRLWIIQLLSLWITSQLLPQQTYAPSVQTAPLQTKPRTFSSAFSVALERAALSMLRLTGAVAFFSALNSILAALLPISSLPQLWQAGIYGSLELSGGIALLGGMARDRAFILSAFLCVWGGVCVHVQAIQAFSDAGLRPGVYLIGKLLQAGFAVLLTVSIQLLRHTSVPVPLLTGGFLIGIGILKIFRKIHWKMKNSVL